MIYDLTVLVDRSKRVSVLGQAFKIFVYLPGPIVMIFSMNVSVSLGQAIQLYVYSFSF